MAVIDLRSVVAQKFTDLDQPCTFFTDSSEMKQFVIDVNTIRTENGLLREYFLASPENEAVIPEYLEHEVLAGDNTAMVRERLRILAEFATRTVVLKNLFNMSQLRPRSKGLRLRLIDDERTIQFRRYVTRAAQHTVGSEIDLLKKSSRANNNMRELFNSVEGIRRYVEKKIDQYPQSDLRDLRANAPISADFAFSIREKIDAHTNYLFQEIGHAGPRDAFTDKYSFQFRFGLSLTVLELYWAKRGTLPKNEKKIRNFVTDMTYVACATYFDGLLTKDEPQQDIYKCTKSILRVLYGIE